MHKANKLLDEIVDLTYTPAFHCGDEVMVSLDAATPQGVFYSGFHWVVGWIDTWWPDEYSYRVVLHHCDCWHCTIPNEIWIKESDLELTESLIEDDEDEPLCRYVPHWVETSLTPEEIRNVYKYQWDDWEWVYYSTMPKEEFEAWLFDDEDDFEDEEIEEEEPKAKKTKKSK